MIDRNTLNRVLNTAERLEKFNLYTTIEIDSLICDLSLKVVNKDNIVQFAKYAYWDVKEKASNFYAGSIDKLIDSYEEYYKEIIDKDAKSKGGDVENEKDL